LGGTNTPYTEAIHVQVGTFGDQDSFLALGDTAAISPYDLLRMVDTNTLQVTRDGDSGATEGPYTGGTIASAGEYRIIKSFTGSTVTVWINGTKVVDAQSYDTNAMTPNTFTIGAWSVNGGVSGHANIAIRRVAVRSTATDDAGAATLDAAWDDA
jgi:hypothetical protein